VLIPALNEAETVGHVVKTVIDELGADVLVIDDGSSDGTAAAARAAGASVFVHPFNIGVGGAIRTGLRYASSSGHLRVLQIDADGQHPPSEAARLVARLDQGDVDLVVGSRFAAGYEVSALRRFSMRLLSRMVSRRVGVTITDTTSGFRAFGPLAVEVFAAAYPSAYLSDTVEALLIAADRGLRVAEVDVRMSPRLGGAPSSGRWRSLWHLQRIVLVVLLHRFRHPHVKRGTS
jgi:glycosyltransferase involved in cell wall biosynthesis